MTMTRHALARAVGLLVVALLVVTAGCSKPPKKRQFNNKLARRNADHASAAKELYKEIAPLANGQMVSSAGPRTALDKCQKALSTTQSMMLDLSPPRGSIAGRDMYNVYKEFVASQQKIYDECFVPIVAIVEDNRRYPTPGAKWAAISPLLQQVDKIEKPAYDALMKAQQEFSAAHGFSPK
jgi:hypothetical protein